MSDIKPSTGRLGFEVSGTIDKIGNSVQGFAVGDEVVAAIPIDVGGGFAEFVAVPYHSIGTLFIFLDTRLRLLLTATLKHDFL